MNPITITLNTDKKQVGPIKAFKAFNDDWTCRDFAYEIGKTYTHDGNVSLCNAGFHACESPLGVLGYYPPTANFAEVELDGVTDEKGRDSKRVGKSITIKAALSIADLVSAQVEWVSKQADANIVSGNYSKAASSGESSTAASSGNYSKAASSGESSTAASSGESSTAASSGDYSTAASSGNYSKAASSGDYSTAASSGDYSTAASSGDYSTAASSGYYSKAASSGDYSTAASSGESSKAASSGDYSTAASSGDYSTAASAGNYSKAEAKGEQTIAMVAGIGGCARAGEQGAFALPWMDKKQVRIAVGIVGEKGILADTWYRISDTGELIAVYSGEM